MSFAAYATKITAIIGPNGAGKTTVFNCLTGFYRPSGGGLALHRDGKTLQLDRIEGFRIVRRAGIARTFQNIRLFAGMTVLENLIVAQHIPLMKASVFSLSRLLGLPRYRTAEQAAVERARHWLDRIGLTDRADWLAARCPTALNAGWRSPVPCAPAPPCCASTSPRPVSIRANPPSSTSCCSRPRRGADRRSC